MDFRRKTNSKSSSYRPYTAQEVDLILVYVPALGEVLRFDPSIFDGRNTLQVRLAPSKNGQQKGVVLAENFVW